MLSGEVRFEERRKVVFERECASEMVYFLPCQVPMILGFYINSRVGLEMDM